MTTGRFADNRAMGMPYFFIAGNDASARSKRLATIVCNGGNDTADLKTAIEEAAGGVVIVDGTIEYNSELDLSVQGATIKGTGWTTSCLKASAAMTNSIHLGNWYMTLKDIKIDGNSLATQLLVEGAFCVLNHVQVTGHTTYNVNHSVTGNVLITNASEFVGVPVKSLGTTSVTNRCNFNGSGLYKCLILDGSGISVMDSTFESFKDTAVYVGANSTTRGFIGNGNYAETAYGNGASFFYLAVQGAELKGNYCAFDASITYLAYIANGWADVASNSANYLPVFVHTDVTAGTYRHTEGINYNSLTGLTALDIRYSKKSCYWGTAAPLAGTWAVGDMVYNSSPSAGSTPGWLCTTAGTPGTWKAMASIAS